MSTCRASWSACPRSARTGHLPNVETSFLQRGGDLRGVALRGDLREDVRHATVAADDQRRALDAHVRLAVIHLLLPNAIPLRHLMADVGEKGEGEAELLLELRLGGDGV